MREIILDTETTGFHAKGNDRIVEIACLEIIDKMPTKNTFHTYVNPGRDVPAPATKVHGITTEFLRDKPTFKSISQNFLDFIADSTLVIHNANFDMSFINAELERVSTPILSMEQSFDTLALARKKFPGANNTLDGLCKRFKIDLSNRTFHGALIDCELLAEVYVELLGGRQRKLFSTYEAVQESVISLQPKELKEARLFPLSQHELDQHSEFVKNDLKNALWTKAS